MKKLLTILLTATLALGLTGCALTEEQAAQLQELKAHSAALKAEYDGLEASYREVQDRVEAGKVPVEEALKLTAEIMSRKGTIEAEFKGIGESITKLNEAPGSKWAVVGAVLGQVLTIATGLKFVKRSAFLTEALGVTARGFDAATKGEGGGFILKELANSNISVTQMQKLTRPLRRKVV